MLSLAHLHCLDVCKGGYKELDGEMCTCVKWLYCEGRVAVGPEATVRNSEYREGGRLREVADTWEPMGKSIGTVQNWPY